MPIDADALGALSLTDVPISYTEEDVMLYALGVGLGRDPLDENELAYVTEHRGLRVLPTFASMIVPDTIMAGSGCDLNHVLHRTQSLEVLRPLPAAGDMLINQKVLSVWDRGALQGAEIEIHTEMRRSSDDTVVCLSDSRIIARADGGFGGSPPPRRSRHRMPDREPDLMCEFATRLDQALLFRLSGDMNPLHSDPHVASRAGFDRPILHGRCTQGIACHAILKTVCNYDFTLISSFDLRFSAPVFPGERVVTEMWQDGNVVSFRARAAGRNDVVINGGRCILAS